MYDWYILCPKFYLINLFSFIIYLFGLLRKGALGLLPEIMRISKFLRFSTWYINSFLKFGETHEKY